MSIQVGTQHITPADGNIFADLGIEPIEARKLQIKSALMMQLTEWIQEKQLEHAEAAVKLNVSKTHITDLMRGKINQFSLDDLVEMVELTGQHVTLSLSNPHSQLERML